MWRDPPIRFGVFEADFPAGQLRKHGSKIKLQVLPFRILTILLERPGQIVSRDELCKNLWPSGVPPDIYHNLNVAIGKLRRALSDDSQHPQYIENIARRGYRFLGTVDAEQRGKGKSRGPKRKRQITLLVLPFKSFSGQPDKRSLVEGLTEELIARVQQLDPERLTIIVWKPGKQFRQAVTGGPLAGKKRTVDYILAGSVRCAGNRVRVIAHLTQVSDGTELWAESYERQLDDVLSIQAEIAMSIVRALQARLLPSQNGVSGRIYQPNAEAYLAYLTGYYHQAKLTKEALNKSIQCFEQVIQEDPHCARAYSGLANSYALLGWLGCPARSSNECFLRAEEAALKALEMDATLAEGYASLAFVKLFHDWDWPELERLAQQAIHLDPASANAHLVYGLYLASKLEFEAAISHVRRAQALSPVSVFTSLLAGLVLYLSRQYDEAIQELSKALDLEPNFVWALIMTAVVYMENSMLDEATSLLEKARVQDSESMRSTAWLGYLYARSGQRNSAEEVLSKLKELWREGLVSAFHVAIVYVGLGRTDRSIEWLQRACEERYCLSPMFGAEPKFDGLRSSSKFQALVQRIAQRDAMA